MKRAILHRQTEGDDGTFGRLSIDDISLFTGELPDRDNAENVSRIPAGIYRCLCTWSPRFKRPMYLVGPVTGRTGIRIHPANLMGDPSKGRRSQLNGCIALGEKVGVMDGQRALLISSPAVGKLERHLNREPFELEIVDVD